MITWFEKQNINMRQLEIIEVIDSFVEQKKKVSKRNTLFSLAAYVQLRIFSTVEDIHYCGGYSVQCRLKWTAYNTKLYSNSLNIFSMQRSPSWDGIEKDPG